MNLIILILTISSFQLQYVQGSIRPGLTIEQEESLDNIAWLYAQFTMTFDKDELDVDRFQEVEDFFKDDNLQHHFSELNIQQLDHLLVDRINQYQSIIMKADKTPIPFKAFYKLFDLFKQQNHLYGPGVTTHRNLWNIMSDKMVKQFCADVKVHSDKDIINALKEFEIKRDFSKNAQKREKLFFKLNTEFIEHLEGKSQNKPKKWTAHHMIPSQTLTQFYRYYFELLSFKSDKIQETHTFDWFKIMEFNTQRSFLVQAKVLWSKEFNSRGATLPIVENRQADFVRAWYRWPPGLVFYGPDQKIRYDDPKNDFEEYAIHIVGTSYYQKAKQLKNEILLFMKKYEQIKTDQDREDISTEAMRLFKLIFTIHKEYNNGKPILIFPFYFKQWLSRHNEIKNDDEWCINRVFNADSVKYDSELRQWIDMNDNSDDGPSIEVWNAKMEWREKSLAQQADNNERLLGVMRLDSIIPNLAVLSLFSTTKYRHDELKRKKRNHFVETTFYVDEILDKCKKMEVVTVKSNDDCDYYLKNGSPSILAVPVYGWCKLFG